MFTFALGIFTIGFAVVLFFVGRSQTTRNRRRNDNEMVELIESQLKPIFGKLMPVLAGFAGLALIGNSLFVEVPAGTRGVVLTFKAAGETALEPGLGFKMPWQDVVFLSTQKYQWTQKFECQSKDLQKINVTMTLVYARKPDRVAQIYKRVRENSEDIDVKPGGRETLKAAVAEYDAAELIQDRKGLSDRVATSMKNWIDKKDLVLIKCSIANVDFESSYDRRVEAKVIALEKARQTQNELLMQKTMAEIQKITASGRKEGSKEIARGENESRQIIAEAKAYQTEVVASANAYSKSIVGAAEAERTVWLAKALGNSRAALTVEAITKWNGDVPQFSMEGGKPELPFEFLKSSEELKSFESPLTEIEAALKEHQELMAKDVARQLEKEKQIEAERIQREKEESAALRIN